MWNARYNAPAAHDLIVGDVIDAGITKDGVLLFVMRLNLAEKFHSGLELVRLEMLVAHHQDVMLDKGALEDGAGVAVDRLGEIDADHLATGVIGQGRNGEGRHRVSLRRDGRLSG